MRRQEHGGEKKTTKKKGAQRVKVGSCMSKTLGTWVFNRLESKRGCLSSTLRELRSLRQRSELADQKNVRRGRSKKLASLNGVPKKGGSPSSTHENEGNKYFAYTG